MFISTVFLFEDAFRGFINDKESYSFMDHKIISLYQKRKRNVDVLNFTILYGIKYGLDITYKKWTFASKFDVDTSPCYNQTVFPEQITNLFKTKGVVAYVSEIYQNRSMGAPYKVC